VIDKILDSIDFKAVAIHTTRNNHYKDDLAQELYLEVRATKLDTLRELFSTGNLKRYVYRLAYLSYNGRTGHFFQTYRRQLEVEPDTGKEITLKEVLEDVELDEMDKMWIKCYLEHNGNFSWIEQDTAITRQYSAKRIKGIAKKCKNSL